MSAASRSQDGLGAFYSLRESYLAANLNLVLFAAKRWKSSRYSLSRESYWILLLFAFAAPNLFVDELATSLTVAPGSACGQDHMGRRYIPEPRLHHLRHRICFDLPQFRQNLRYSALSRPYDRYEDDRRVHTSVYMKFDFGMTRHMPVKRSGRQRCHFLAGVVSSYRLRFHRNARMILMQGVLVRPASIPLPPF